MKWEEIPIQEITVDFTNFCVGKFRDGHIYEEWTLKNYLHWFEENYLQLRELYHA